MTPSIKEALEHYAHEYCEGWCEQDAGCANFDDCGGCLARRALATLQPDGERRDAIARLIGSFPTHPHDGDEQYVLHDAFPGDYDSRTAKIYELTDMLLASGLVQDEAGIRADEREKCAKIAEREAEFWQDAESSSARIVAANIRSARDGGAET